VRRRVSFRRTRAHPPPKKKNMPTT
jgi:hypothetical protein